MIPPNVTHAPCDLNQQKKRDEARAASLARAVAVRSGRRSLLERLLRRTPRARDLTAADSTVHGVEDVLHSLRA